MKKPISYTANNAAKKDTFVGMLYEKGVQQTKNEILNQIGLDARRLYEEGYIHIHDLEAYGLTYNCLSLDILNSAKINMCNTGNDFEKIFNIIEYYKELIANIGNEQSGGISFANFDYEISTLFSRFEIAASEVNLDLLSLSLKKFLNWINKTRTRYGEECYYVTLNMGLDTSIVGRHVIQVIISELYSSDFMIRPNIVIKVKEGTNAFASDVNYDILQQAVQCSCKRMNPTYLNCDSESSAKIDNMNLSIMGCRTNVGANLFGDTTSIGRGNIANISINLPRIAFEIVEDKSIPFDARLSCLYKNWEELADKVCLILLDRYKKTCRQKVSLFPANKEYQLWNVPFEKKLGDTFKNGTLSVGFIGLSETIEILFDKKIYEDEDTWRQTIDFVKFMRAKIDQNISQYHLNFSLLATSGEGISSRFLDIDRQYYSHICLDKGYYTNSFHIEVDSNISAFRKLELEGPYHKYCNGGSISYVELGEAPIHNPNALTSILKYAIKNDINYLGFNFPLDICKNCRYEGFFDSCPNCHSHDVYRIRRVSGYLEILGNFGKGKMNEEKNREKNHFGT